MMDNPSIGSYLFSFNPMTSDCLTARWQLGWQSEGNGSLGNHSDSTLWPWWISWIYWLDGLRDVIQGQLGFKSLSPSSDLTLTSPCLIFNLTSNTPNTHHLPLTHRSSFKDIHHVQMKPSHQNIITPFHPFFFFFLKNAICFFVCFFWQHESFENDQSFLWWRAVVHLEVGSCSRLGKSSQPRFPTYRYIPKKKKKRR